jgi:ribosomal protein L11 methylase PrmA
MQAIHSVCKEGTEVLLSGFLSTDADVIKTALEANGLAFKAMSQQKDWICIKAQLS